MDYLRKKPFRKKIILILIGFLYSGTTLSQSNSTNCYEASFIFAKIAVASINCNFPNSEDTNKALAYFGKIGTNFCGNGPAANWPGSTSGAQAFYEEIQNKGRGSVCGRIYGEVLDLDPRSPKGKSENSACKRFPNLC